ncbi:MAG: hypothetical protein IKD23_00365, partial [Lentisphaeria bacterium]|nr:hypothetical protein [Lentisphaeria bacterium]
MLPPAHPSCKFLHDIAYGRWCRLSHIHAIYRSNCDQRLATAYCKEAGSSAITSQPAERAFRRL